MIAGVAPPEAVSADRCSSTVTNLRSSPARRSYPEWHSQRLGIGSSAGRSESKIAASRKESVIAEHPWVFGWDALVAIGTIGLALATALLAWRTSAMAQEGRLAFLQADLHHRQQLTCLLAVDSCILEQVPVEFPGVRLWQLVLTEKVRNLGNAPAFRNRVELHLPGNVSANPKYISSCPEVQNFAANSSSESGQAVAFFTYGPEPLDASRWTWKDATVTFVSHTIFDQEVRVVYDFDQWSMAVGSSDEYGGDNWRFEFRAKPFDLNNCGTNAVPKQAK